MNSMRIYNHMEAKPKIIVVLGQTSTGKSDFAVQVAKTVHGEIISADSRQVYKGMDLGTGKITKKEMQKVPHHLLDVAPPSKVFSVSDYKKLADKQITEILQNKNIPILCGGTGFYIDAVVDGIILPEVSPNKNLRAKLTKKSPEQLFKLLQKLDPVRAKTIDHQNPVRLIRAIEIATTLGSVPSPKQGLGLGKYDALKIGLILPDSVLREKIHKRLDVRIKKGMLKEIANLHQQGLSWKRMEMLGLEYRHGAMYLQGKITKIEMLEKLRNKSWQYAKRQQTWFKRDSSITWINPQKTKDVNKIMKKIKEFLK